MNGSIFNFNYINWQFEGFRSYDERSSQLLLFFFLIPFDPAFAELTDAEPDA